MTPEQINREIAEKVMQAVEGDPETAPAFQVSPLGKIILTLTVSPYNWFEFDPSHRTDHAMMALDKFGDWMIEKTANGQYYCRIGWGFTEGVWATTKEEAICLAVLEAMPPTKL